MGFPASHISVRGDRIFWVPDDGGGRGENGAELAGSERLQGAQPVFEFGRG